jgi:hypothetical protein
MEDRIVDFALMLFGDLHTGLASDMEKSSHA